jgi:hypothetical protein
MRVLALSLVLASVAACTFTSAVSFGPAGPPRDPARVPVLAATHLARPHDVVGQVVAQKDGDDPREAADELRRLAAAMGADAVIGVTLEMGFGVWNIGQHLFGTAVRYR